MVNSGNMKENDAITDRQADWKKDCKKDQRPPTVSSFSRVASSNHAHAITAMTLLWQPEVKNACNQKNWITSSIYL